MQDHGQHLSAKVALDFDNPCRLIAFAPIRTECCRKRQISFKIFQRFKRLDKAALRWLGSGPLQPFNKDQRPAVTEQIPEIWATLARKIWKALLKRLAKFHRSRIVAFRQNFQRHDVLGPCRGLAHDLRDISGCPPNSLP